MRPTFDMTAQIDSELQSQIKLNVLPVLKQGT